MSNPPIGSTRRFPAAGFSCRGGACFSSGLTRPNFTAGGPQAKRDHWKSDDEDPNQESDAAECHLILIDGVHVPATAMVAEGSGESQHRAMLWGPCREPLGFAREL